LQTKAGVGKKSQTEKRSYRVKNAQTSSLAKTAGRLAFELLIVFVGVYAAFWVDNWRTDLAVRERAREVALTIQLGLDDVIGANERFVTEVSAGLSAWQAARDRGELVAPYFFRIGGSEHAPREVYEAIIQSQPAELFDTKLMFDLGYFYSELLGVGDRYVRYAEFTESAVLPNLKRDVSVFYEPDESRLLPEFDAHMDRLRELVEWWSADLTRAEDLKRRFEALAQ